MAAKRKSDLLVTAFELVADSGWTGMSLVALADRAGKPLVDVYRELPDRGAVLRALSERTDQAMLGIDRRELEGLPARDAIFELMMRRFEALGPFRAGLARLEQDGRRDPAALLMIFCRLDRSIRWMQDLAGMRSQGLRPRFQRRALLAVYLQVLRTWLADDSADLAKTMARLDSLLRQAERFAGLGGSPTPSGGEAPEPA
ncbi:MAG: hypothetical protein AAF637_27905 [Pseudomonadota bacterium]